MPVLLLMFFQSAEAPSFVAPTYQTPDGRAFLVGAEDRVYGVPKAR